MSYQITIGKFGEWIEDKTFNAGFVPTSNDIVVNVMKLDYGRGIDEE